MQSIKTDNHGHKPRITESGSQDIRIPSESMQKQKIVKNLGSRFQILENNEEEDVMEEDFYKSDDLMNWNFVPKPSTRMADEEARANINSKKGKSGPSDEPQLAASCPMIVEGSQAATNQVFVAAYWRL